MSPTPQTYVMFALIPLILWRMYSRIRRMVGRQKSIAWRQRLTVFFFPLVILSLGFISYSQPESLIALIGGLAIGTGLGIFGHRLTRFEQTDEGLFYTPNAHLGIALSLLLAGRIMYRYIFLGFPGANPGPTPASTIPTPLTLVLIGMLAGYYFTYALGLMLWRRRMERNDQTIS
jgi:hypothetical protein